MKKSLRLITTLCFAIIINCSCYKVANAQYVTIPDANFVTWLNNHGYSQCLNGNQMDTTCNAVVSATIIDCSHKIISSLEGIQYFNNLSQLDCNHNILSSLSALPPILQVLNCQNNNLSGLPPLPATLHYLYADYNQFTSLPALPSLWALNCSYNQLTTLPTLANTLYDLSFRNNQITNIPVFPNSLNYLDCAHNQLTTIPSLPNTLITFYCDGNQLSNIPVLPNTLTTLSCNNTQIVTLPALPNTLTFIDCGNNPLVSLPVIPSTVRILRCRNNLLTQLPILPNNLNYLSCDSNQLSILPPLPSTLVMLKCNYNLLTSIPNLPDTLSQLICDNNLLSSLPELNDSMYSVNCANNPFLFCLPQLKRIVYLDFSNTNITCLPNYGSVTTSIPTLASLQLCDLFNVSGCQSFWNISGKVYSDININCIAELSEPKLDNMKLLLYDSTGNLLQQTFSGGEGLYSFDTDTGTNTYTIDTANLPVLVTCPALGYHTSILTSIDSMDYDMDFGMQCKPGFDIGVNSIVRTAGGFRPGFNATVNIKAGDMSNKYGLHCSSGISGDVSVVINGTISYVSAFPGSLIPTVNGDTLTYSIADFDTVDFNSDFKIIVQTDSSAIIGSQICFDVNVTPTSGDNNPSNNNLQNCFTVVGSYDPNEKSVYPANRMEDKNGSLTYTINFQNTGTAPAQHIYILDTLDPAIDESSFELLAYSHQPQVQIIGNVVRFNFPNINLPDSVNDEPNSHGYVQYRVKLKDSLPQATIIQNTSYIYFDFNTAVQTNTVVDTLTDCNNLASIQFPNPNFCNGDTVFANAMLGYTANTDWYVDSVFVSNNQNIFIPNLSIGNHEIKLIASNAYCNVEVISNIQVHDLPVVSLGNDTATCNASVQLDAGAGNISYQWSNGETTQSIIATTTNNYSVVATDANGCANAGSISITINELPVVTLNAFPNSDTLCINAGVQTISNGNPIGGTLSGTGVSGNNFNPTQAALGWNLISYLYTDTNGCTNIATDSVFVDLCLGVNSISGNETFYIYPNPATDEITISYNFRNSSHIKIELYNSIGEKIKVLVDEKYQATGNPQGFKNLAGLTQGIYFIKVSEDKNVFVMKLVVE